MKIIYRNESDVKEFDIDRYLKSLNRYGKVTKEQVEKELQKYPYNPLSVTCLIEIGVHLLDTENGQNYFNDHRYEGINFLRLIRTTGYITGDYRRSNDAKIAEYAARLVHGVGHRDGVFSPDEKDAKEAIKLAYVGIAMEVNNGKM